LLDDDKVGSIYIQSDSKELYVRMRLYAIIAAAVVLGSALVALGLSSRLQRVISRPILELAQTASMVSSQKNYSVRAERRTGDELGLLVDRFNEMLSQIQERDQKIRDSEKRYRTLIDSQREGVAVFDADGKFVFTNPAVHDIFGVEQGTLLGRNLRAFSGEERESPNDGPKDFATLPELKGPEIRIVRPDGEQRILSVTAKPDFPSIGSTKGVFGVFTDITERKRAEEALHYRVELERMITAISTDFISRESGEVDAAIEDALAAIGAFTDVDRSYIFLFSEDGNMMSNTHEWCAPGIESKQNQLQDLPVKGYPWWHDSLVRDKHIHIPRVSELPPEAAAEKYILEMQEIQSLLAVPMLSGDSLIGFLGFDSVACEKTWMEEDSALLKMLAKTFVDAMERKRAEERIKSSLAEKEVLLKEIHHRVKNNLQVVSSLLKLQSKAINDEHALEMFKDSQNRVRSMALIHEKLYQTRDLARIDFAAYVKDLAGFLLRSYERGSGRVRIDVEVEDVHLGIDSAIPCGLIINELVSNSLKHAFPGGREGAIKVHLMKDPDGGVRLVTWDDGIGVPADLDFRNTQSLGLQLVNRLTEQLGGTITLRRDRGTVFDIRFMTVKEERKVAAGNVW
jgi:PAS domain S-box-containing protein